MYRILQLHQQHIEHNISTDTVTMNYSKPAACLDTEHSQDHIRVSGSVLNERFVPAGMIDPTVCDQSQMSHQLTGPVTS